jgi:hypothetical protein
MIYACMVHTVTHQNAFSCECLPYTVTHACKLWVCAALCLQAHFDCVQRVTCMEKVTGALMLSTVLRFAICARPCGVRCVSSQVLSNCRYYFETLCCAVKCKFDRQQTSCMLFAAVPFADVRELHCCQGTLYTDTLTKCLKHRSMCPTGHCLANVA